MHDFILFMHGRTTTGPEPDAWPAYLARLRASGAFEGGSRVGPGACFRKTGPVPEPSEHVTGFLRVRAADLEAARAFLEGNPVYEAGGVVGIRALPRD